MATLGYPPPRIDKVNSMLVLQVEDNRKLATNIVEFLELEAIECDYTERGDHGLTLAQEGHFDVILTFPA